MTHERNRERFGNIREILHKPPCAENWEALIKVFAAHNPQQQESELLPYVRSHLNTWPDELRTWHKSWTKRFYNGTLVPVAGLARQLNLNRTNLASKGIDRWHKHTRYITEIKNLTVYGERDLTTQLIQDVWAHPILSRIDQMSFFNCDIDGRAESGTNYRNWFEQLIRTYPRPEAIRHFAFEMEGWEMTGQMCHHLLEGRTFPNLQSLHFDVREPRSVANLSRIEHIGKLKKLSMKLYCHDDLNAPFHLLFLNQLEHLRIEIGHSRPAHQLIMDLLRHGDFSTLKVFHLDHHFFHFNVEIFQGLSENETLMNLDEFKVNELLEADRKTIAQARYLKAHIREQFAAE